MIGYIRGIIIKKQAPELLIDVGGLGYELQASMGTFYHLPETGQEVSLYTHLIVREDAHVLYAFYEEQERRLFRSLIRVNGVGPKLAVAILSGMDSDDFVRCVHGNDIQSLVRLPGVGKKTAERLLIEMRDRLKDWQQPTVVGTDQHASQSSTPEAASSVMIQDAESALVSLGYKPQEASRAIMACLHEGHTSSEALIRDALRGMVQR